MYKKKDKKATVIAAVVVLLFFAVIFVLPQVAGSMGKNKNIQETEPEEYEVLIHKTDAGKIDIKKSWLKTDGTDETTLSIAPGTLVSLNLTPRKNKHLTSVQVVDARDFANTISTIVSETKDNTYTIDFSMPATDVVMTFQFETLETEMPAADTDVLGDHEMETENVSEKANEGNPYGLTIHGITAEIIKSYNGMFDDRDFCQQLGDQLHLDSPRSEYYGVTDVTFSQEPYEGEQDTDKVYHLIYLGDNPEEKLLAAYYRKDRSYVFSRYAGQEPETAEEGTQDGNTSAGNESAGGTTYVVPGTPATAGTSPSTVIIPGKTTTTSFDILQVSKVFLDYTGDQERFYSEAFEYILDEGMTGAITGTMKDYHIDPEARTAEINISLNTGESMRATYDKANDQFTFSGL